MILGLEHQSLFSSHPEEIIELYLIKCKHNYHNTIIMQWALIISENKALTLKWTSFAFKIHLISINQQNLALSDINTEAHK